MCDSRTVFDEACAKEIVKQALKRVATFSGDEIELFTFNRFLDFHRLLFIAALKAEVRSITVGDIGFYDICLNDDSLAQWQTVGECIEWVYQNKGLSSGNTKKLSHEDLGR